MFQLEKEMIPVLKRDLSKLFGAVHSAEEFSSGNGRPDLVFARISSEQAASRDALPDYHTLHLLVKHLNRQGRTFHIDEVFGVDVSHRKRIQAILELLTENGFVEFKDESHLVVRRTYQPIADEFVSIEAKLSDWRSGVFQAMRYKTFSNSAYLAISHKFVDRVDRALLRNSGVGLIEVSSEGATLVVKAKTRKPASLISNYYLSERLVDQINQIESSSRQPAAAHQHPIPG